MRPTLLLLALLAFFPGLAADDSARRYLGKADAWFASAEAKKVADIILSYQADVGGWPKNTDTVSQPYAGDRSKLQPTFDNKGTVDELRFMARMVNATKAEAYRDSFDRGLAYVLKAQYANGGWPQFFPLRKGYYDRITFNDGAMVRVLEFVREVGRDERYAFLDAKVRASCRQAFDRGIACILKCQIVVEGQPTVWCAQHDETTFAPAPARNFEPASLSGMETVGITRFLMAVEQPSPEIIAAVEGAVAWLESVRVKGLKVENFTGADGKRDRGSNQC